MYYRTTNLGDRIVVADSNNEPSDNVVVILDTFDSGRDDNGIPRVTKAEIDRWMREMEPCQPADDGCRRYADPWQRRPSRSKNKSPAYLRVEKRRRRKRIAKETQRLMRLAEQKRESERGADR